MLSVNVELLRGRQSRQVTEWASKLPEKAVIRNFIEFSRRESILGAFRKIAKSGY